MKDGHLIFLVGPTACGKTEAALAEAERSGAVILSCDSLCVYRGMDIGTAKPTREEQARVPHFGIDLAEPDEPYSVSRYIRYRDGILEGQRALGKTVIVAGGSGFYLRSFFHPVVDGMEIPAGLGGEVADLRRACGLEGLVAALRELNPEGETFEGLDLRNPRRVEKALIRCRASGRSWRALREEFLSLPVPLPDWTKEVRLIERPPGELRERNRRRVRRMLESGLVDEVRALRARGFERNSSACRAIGYREVLAFLDGKLPEADLEEAIYTHTNQLMRKQRSWFRHQIPVDRVVP
ncbi:MAG: tRNA (adenosine(37)-N6)-dimethylallyltransferase MiaA [Oceanipulchritudo sp.]